MQNTSPSSGQRYPDWHQAFPWQHDASEGIQLEPQQTCPDPQECPSGQQLPPGWEQETKLFCLFWQHND